MKTARRLPRWVLPALRRLVRAGLGLVATIVLAGAVTLLIAGHGASLSGDGDDERPGAPSAQPTRAALWSGPADTRAARARALLASFLGRSGEMIKRSGINVSPAEAIRIGIKQIVANG